MEQKQREEGTSCCHGLVPGSTWDLLSFYRIPFLQKQILLPSKAKKKFLKVKVVTILML